MLELSGFRRSVEAAAAGCRPVSPEIFRQIIAILAVCKAQQGVAPPYFWLAEGTAAYPPALEEQYTVIMQLKGDHGHDWLGLLTLLALLNAGFWYTGSGAVWLRHRCDCCLQSCNVGGELGIVQVWAGCIDGVTLGHRCCAVEGCTVNMPSGWIARHCSVHAHLRSVCAVKSCSAVCDADAGEHTCTEHRAVEQAYNRQKDKGGYMARLPRGSADDTEVCDCD
jgi:CxC6 like cysteine cluster associated with KDZ transposases